MLEELEDQLESDGYGVDGFEKFSRACFQLARDDESREIACFATGVIAGWFVDHFAERPLPVDLAEARFQRIGGYARTIEAEAAKACEDQLRLERSFRPYLALIEN